MQIRSVADRWTVITLHNGSLDVADIQRKTGFNRPFINRWINKYDAGKTHWSAKEVDGQDGRGD